VVEDHVDDPARREPTRYELIPVDQRQLRSFWTARTPPPLVLEVSATDVVRISDPTTDETVVSAPLAQVTATPAIYEYGGSSEADPVIESVLVITVPGSPPVSIKPLRMKGDWGEYRYGWHGVVDRTDRPGYLVSEAVWLALIEKFGLVDRIPDDQTAIEIDRRNRRAAIKAMAYAAALIVLLALSAYLQYR
jgi:hypothetical protein